MMRGGSALRSIGLAKEFFGVRVLDDVDFDLRHGEVHALVGQNGSGKSTFAKVLSGAYKKTAGTIEVGGERAEIQSTRDAIALGVALIPQEPNLVPQMTAVENVFLGKEISNRGVLDASGMRQAAKAVFERLESMPDLDAPVGNLSVAAQETIAIARALLYRAGIFIFDEPTASLSGQEIDKLFAVVRALKLEGASVVFISHRLDEVFGLADRITVLRDGRVVATKDIEDVGRDELVRLMIGYEAVGIEGDVAGVRREPGEVLLAVEDVPVARHLEGVSFELRSGEVVGILGQVGAGKSELVRSVIGARRRSGGTVFVSGLPTRIRSPRDAARNGIGFLPEDRLEGLVPLMGVEDNILLAGLDSVCGTGGAIDPVAARKSAQRLVDDLQIAFKTRLSEPVRYLSGGNQQKVMIARWLHCDARVLIFDEPTRGIDVVAKARVHRLIRELAECGKAILIVTSEYREALGLCDRILVMRDGTVTAEFAAGEATEEQLVEMAV